jgi:hypothetical protein
MDRATTSSGPTSLQNRPTPDVENTEHVVLHSRTDPGTYDRNAVARTLTATRER